MTARRMFIGCAALSWAGALGLAPAHAQTYRVELPDGANNLRLAGDAFGRSAVAYGNAANGTTVIAYGNDGAARWATRFDDEDGSSNGRRWVVATSDGGALVAGPGYTARLDGSGAVLSAFELPQADLVPQEMLRLADDRVLLIASTGTGVAHLVVANDGSSQVLNSGSFNYQEPGTSLTGPFDFAAAASPDGGWVSAHTVLSVECCSAVRLLSGHAPDGALLWAYETDSASSPGSGLAVLGDGRVVTSWAFLQNLVLDPGGGLLSRFTLTSGKPRSIAPTPDGGCVLVGAAEQLTRLEPGLTSLRWSRSLASTAGARVLASPDGGLWVASDNFFDRTLLRLDASGQAWGACSAETSPASDSLAPVDGPLGLPNATTGSFGAGTPVTPVPRSLAPLTAPGVPAALCFDPRPEVAAVGGQVGAAISFLSALPLIPNGVSVLLASASGTGSLPLPGGVVVNLTADTLTLELLQLPAQSIAALDGNGEGATQPIPLPAGIGLTGLTVTYVALALDAATLNILQVTIPKTVALQ